MTDTNFILSNPENKSFNRNAIYHMRNNVSDTNEATTTYYLHSLLEPTGYQGIQ